MMFKHIKESLGRIEKDHKADKEAVHGRINAVERTINKEVKPQVQETKTDMVWIKKAFWILVGGTVTFGSSAVLALILIIIGGGT